jgi:hypothetical protein
MGASSSDMAAVRVKEDVFLRLPIPKEVYDPIHAWARKTNGKRKRENPDFVKFINTPALVNQVYTYGTMEFEQFIDKVFRHFNSMPALESFWGQQCEQGALFSRKCRFLSLIEVGDEVSVDDTSARSRMLYDTKFVQSTLYTAVCQGAPCVIPLYLSVRNPQEDTTHANMALVKYRPDTRVVSCIIFEPHAEMDSAKNTVNGMRTFLYDSTIYCGDVPDVQVDSPWSSEGLQGYAPVCVQWSALMFFSYMFTCELHAACNPLLTRLALKKLWRVRAVAIPVWMYYMYTLGIKHETGDTTMHADFGTDSEIDVYRCAEQSTCTDPCVRGADGQCFNKHLFPGTPQ